MRISALQYDIAWMDIDSNIKMIQNHVSQLDTDIDLLVLPEMYLTGFNMNAKEASISEDSDAVRRLTAIAKDYNIALIGSLAIQDNEQYYNRVLLIGADGIIARYDKQYLFSPSGESEQFSIKYPANLITYNGCKILPQVCYDLRFPEGVRHIGEMPDIILYMANWPEGRIHHWDALLRARAIENQCYVIGCNTIGTDENGWKFPGHSQVISHSGEVYMISEKSIEHTIDRKNLMDYREKYPFWKDKK